MYKKNKPAKTDINTNQSSKGESIELKIARILANKEKVTDAAPKLYTERKDGVQPEYDIRHDKWDAAAEAADLTAELKKKSREKRTLGEQAKENMEIEAKDQSTQASGDNNPGPQGSK